MVKTSFETLPLDMQMEILSRLPLKSLMGCMCVSKKWAAFIRSKAFRDHYLSRSMTRPRVLFVANHREFHKFTSEAFFYSVYQEEEPLWLSGKQQMRSDEVPLLKVSQPIRGLICQQGNTKIVICNPGSKKCRTLPQIKVPKGASMTSFFGYDKDKDVFKVLCITKATKEYQVCTVRSDEESSSWRPIRCEHDHAPVTEGLFKGGVLYYGAMSSSDKSVVMSFNVSSEEFSVIELPSEVKIDHHWTLVNYKGDIALVNNIDYELNRNGVFIILVRKDVAGNWKRETIEIPHWTKTVDNKKFYFKGTIGRGELAFAPDTGTWFGGPLFVLYYDEATTNFKSFEIKGMVGQYHSVRTFLDHVDSTWLM
ncbi:unnamed protein product [Arabidopsis arenosa]|uniref:F-box domain-containing protein n=1 Tax=Arabidopsis arenosa TaxID=38785 RepID=A0A8S1ZPI1_ARAAE|nr:unnamed protein product [Arabidopsis arenosa]